MGTNDQDYYSLRSEMDARMAEVKSTGTIKRIFIGFAVVFFVLTLLFFALGVAPFAVFLLLLGVICLIVGIRQASKYKAAKKKMRELEPQYNALNRQVMDGTYPFPSMEFYEACAKAGVTSVDDPYSGEKARNIAFDVMTAWKFPPERMPGYLADPTSVQRYFAEGKQLSEERLAQKAAEAAAEAQLAAELEEQRVARNRAGRYAVLDVVAREKFNFAGSLLPMYGSAKRAAMLAGEIKTVKKCADDYQKRYDAAIEKANKELREFNYTHVQKEKNWGIAGGIAEGIAGPAAGVAAALDTMQQNQQIRASNEAAYQVGAQLWERKVNQAAHLSDLAEKEREKQRELEREYAALAKKIVVSAFPPAQLFEGLVIEEKTVARKNTNSKGNEYLEVNVKVKSTRDASLPANANVVVDGCLIADILLDGRQVSSAVVPLPVYGVPCGGKAVEATGIGDGYIEADKPLDVVLHPANLWIMDR